MNIYQKIILFLQKQSPRKRNLIIAFSTLFIILVLIPPLSGILNKILNKDNRVQKSEFEVIEETVQNEDLSKIEYEMPEIQKEHVYKTESENNFKEHNVIEFSDIKIEDGLVKLKAINKGEKTIRGLSISFYDNNNQNIKYELDIKDKLKSDKSMSIEYDYTGDGKELYIESYSYYVKHNDYFNNVFIDFTDNTASYVASEIRVDMD